MLIDCSHNFLGHNGIAMITNESFYFANYFDWIFLKNKIIKKSNDPKHAYIKIDFLRRYLKDILSIKNDFILVSGCGDSSPIIEFPEESKKILEMPNLKKWYAENNLLEHKKMFSLSVGFATHSVEYEDYLISLNKKINIYEKKDKIMSCFRMRTNNINGEQYLERPFASKFINNNKLYIESHIASMGQYDFLKTLSQYKWCFCPLGNGCDHAPKLLECLFLKTIPIAKKNYNSYNLYKNYPILWIDDFDVILDEKILQYDPNINWDKIISEFTCEYWFKKIINEV